MNKVQYPKIIANEYDFSVSNINYKVESFVGKSTLQTQANERALMEEEFAKNRLLEKQKQQEEAMLIIKNNLKENKKKKQQNGLLKEQIEEEKKAHRQKIGNYNKQIQQKCLNMKNKTSNNMNIAELENQDSLEKLEKLEKQGKTNLRGLITNFI